MVRFQSHFVNLLEGERSIEPTSMKTLVTSKGIKNDSFREHLTYVHLTPLYQPFRHLLLGGHFNCLTKHRQQISM